VPKERLGARWWRFDEYRIVDRYIRPAPNARLREYDPWEVYWNQIEGRVSEPPYLRLANLFNALPRPRGVRDPDRLTTDQKNSLLSWCSEHGLLGLLPGMVQLVKLRGPEVDGGPPNIRFRRRVGDKWISWEPSEALRSDTYSASRSEALVDRGYASGPTFEPLTETWAGFFPDVPSDQAETFDYPELLSKQFWRQYAEHCGEFDYAVKSFSLAVVRLAQRGTDATESDRSGLTEEYALRTLNDFMRSTDPVLMRDEKGGFRRELRSPSLIGMMAMMAAEDLQAGRYLYQCPCGKLIASSYPDTKYCSPQHREKYRKREQRQREKEKSKGRSRARKSTRAASKKASRRRN